MNGWYDFGNVATDQTYQLKISGPGIRTRSKEIEIKYVPGRIGNIDYYIPVERSADTVAFRPVETYRPKQIAPDARTIEDLYSHIPGITYEDGYLTDENGATVCLMFSGIIPDEAGYANYFDKSDRRQHRAYRILQTGQPGRAVLRRGIEFRNCRSEFQCPLH